MMTTQACPNCARAHDVNGTAIGQEVACPCGSRFLVRTAKPQGTASPDDPTEKVELEGTFVGAKAVELPGYELMHLLGRGGMGEVWLARQRSLERLVAVKLLPPRLAKDPEFVTRFEKEATALAALNHPHIIQIIDRGVVGEHYFFVMEYVEGRSLRDVMRQLSPQESLRIALSVARAIECAHDKDIIHRDLKPENILLDGRGHAKVADFGLAGIRRPDSKLQLTATSVAMGTLNYMAPEQRRDAKNVDGRADLFSLGVVLYEALTGELPVGRFRLPSERVPGLDPRVDAVVERLLENEPDSRYAKASEVCEALEALVSTTSRPAMPAQPEGWGTRLKAGWKRLRSPLAVVGGVVVLGSLAQSLLGVSLDQLRVRFGIQEAQGQQGTLPWPANTNANLVVSAAQEKLADGRVRLLLNLNEGRLEKEDPKLEPGQAELNCHAGTWAVVDGKLSAKQGGSDASGGDGRLIPRTYLSDHYFSSNDFSAEVRMDLRRLGPDYPEAEPDAQHFGELTYRVKDLQVSVFAIADGDMRLLWRYTTPEGKEVVGNSSQDVADLTEDETPTPKDGPFRVGLRMKQRKGGVEVEGRLNGRRFAHKLLEGLEGRSAKVAVGCRNMACTFDDLKVEALPAERERRKTVASEGQE
jgi:serine/threonine-protein kinase